MDGERNRITREIHTPAICLFIFVFGILAILNLLGHEIHQRDRIRQEQVIDHQHNNTIITNTKYSGFNIQNKAYFEVEDEDAINAPAFDEKLIEEHYKNENERLIKLNEEFKKNDLPCLCNPATQDMYAPIIGSCEQYCECPKGESRLWGLRKECPEGRIYGNPDFVNHETRFFPCILTPPNHSCIKECIDQHQLLQLSNIFLEYTSCTQVDELWCNDPTYGLETRQLCPVRCGVCPKLAVGELCLEHEECADGSHCSSVLRSCVANRPCTAEEAARSDIGWTLSPYEMCQTCTCTEGTTVSKTNLITCKPATRIRPEIHDVSVEEFKVYADAINLLRKIPSPEMPAHTLYEVFAQYYFDTFKEFDRKDRHQLPWMRRFLYEFESQLISITGNCAIRIPYWDYTLNHATSSKMWSNDYFGSLAIVTIADIQTKPVLDGQFGDWNNLDKYPFGNKANWTTSNGEGQDLIHWDKEIYRSGKNFFRHRQFGITSSHDRLMMIKNFQRLQTQVHLVSRFIDERFATSTISTDKDLKIGVWDSSLLPEQRTEDTWLTNLRVNHTQLNKVNAMEYYDGLGFAPYDPLFYSIAAYHDLLWYRWQKTEPNRQMLTTEWIHLFEFPIWNPNIKYGEKTNARNNFFHHGSKDSDLSMTTEQLEQKKNETSLLRWNGVKNFNVFDVQTSHRMFLFKDDIVPTSIRYAEPVDMHLKYSAKNTTAILDLEQARCIVRELSPLGHGPNDMNADSIKPICMLFGEPENVKYFHHIEGISNRAAQDNLEHLLCLNEFSIMESYLNARYRNNYSLYDCLNELCDEPCNDNKNEMTLTFSLDCRFYCVCGKNSILHNHHNPDPLLYHNYIERCPTDYYYVPSSGCQRKDDDLDCTVTDILPDHDNWDGPTPKLKNSAIFEGSVASDLQDLNSVKDVAREQMDKETEAFVNYYRTLKLDKDTGNTYMLSAYVDVANDKTQR